MTLTIQTQEDDKRQLNVTVEVPEERVTKEMRKKVQKLSRQIRIPGFRPGKAPYQLVVNYVGGAESVRHDTVHDMVEPIFREMMNEIDVAYYALPSVTDVQIDPFVMQVTIPLEPVVVLGDYRSERRNIEPVEIAPDAVDEALAQIRERHAMVEPVDRSAEIGDIVTVAGTGYVADDEDDVIFKEDRFDVTLEEGAVFAGTPFADNLLGSEPGDDLSFSFTFADDYEEEELQGKEAHFSLTVLDIKQRRLPELDDDLAREEGAESLEELRASTTERLQSQAEEQAKNDLIESLTVSLIENVEELVYSPIIIERELDDMVDQLRQRIEQIGIEFDRYLAMMGQSEADMREEREEEAVDRVERRLVITKFVETEYLQVTGSEFEAEFDNLLGEYDEDDEMRTSMQNYLIESGGTMIVNKLIMDKLYDRYMVILKGEAPDLDVLKAEREAAEAEEVVAEAEEVAAEAVEYSLEATAIDDAVTAQVAKEVAVEAVEVAEEVAIEVAEVAAAAEMSTETNEAEDAA
ncbi:MAG: trigger factor [Anaerolineae bacterium]|nr:trigger factor [Anaerolineae bacterium]